MMTGDKCGESIKGVIWPVRLHQDRGLIIHRGPCFKENQKALAGTSLQDSLWSDVEDYVSGKRGCPLI